MIKKRIVGLLLTVITGITGQQIQQPINTTEKIFTCESELLTNEDLNNYVHNFSSEVYGIDIPNNITIKFDDLNSLLVNGLFNPEEKVLIINENIINDKELCERTVIHETIHLCLYLQGLSFEDDNNYFQEECVNNGGIVNNTNENKGFYSHLEGNEKYDIYNVEEEEKAAFKNSFELKRNILTDINN